MSPRNKTTENENLPKYIAECATCGIRFEVSKTMDAKIKEDEFHEFILDPAYKRSLLIATVYLPRCPRCTGGMLKAADRAKVKTTLPVLLFETEITKDEKDSKIPTPDTPTTEAETVEKSI